MMSGISLLAQNELSARRAVRCGEALHEDLAGESAGDAPGPGDTSMRL
jgi:hypothetical protein